MAMIDTVLLEVKRPERNPRKIENPEEFSRAAKVTVSVTFDIFFNQREIEQRLGYNGRIEILGGGGSRLRKLFDLTWIQLLTVDFGYGHYVLPISQSSFRVDPSNGETQSLRRESQVMSANLNEDPSMEIRFSDSPPPGVPTLGRLLIPTPENPVPPPFGLPSFPIRDEAIDRITARVVLESTSFVGTISRDSDAVLGTF